MKIERTKNAIRNIVFGGILKAYQIFVPFIIRTVMIYFMGVQYVGLNSLFTSILQVLNLAELGVGSAMVYSMYKPIVEDDTDMICSLLRLYRFYYRVIGAVIAGVGIIIAPFIPKLISGEFPNGVNVHALYFLNLGATVLSYWLFSYKYSLFQAHQRVDITNKVILIINTIQYGLQLLVIMIFRNYYFYIIITLISQVFINIITAIVATKMYPHYKPVGKLNREVSREINQRIKDLFTSKIGGVIVSSADTVVISAFLGLTVLAIYQNYYFIMASVIGFISVVFTACTAGIGNSLIVETKEKNFEDLKKFTFLISWVAGFCASCFLCLFQPFMDIWVGEKLKLPFSAIICFCIYFYIYEVNQLLNTYKDAGGIWHQDRFRPLVTAIVNLTMNLIMVQFWGIYGVLLSTVLSMLIVGMPWMLSNLFTILFEKKQFTDYLRKVLFYAAVSLIVCTITGVVCNFIHIGKWFTLIIRGVICCILPNALFGVIYKKLPEFRACLQLVDKMTKNKLRLENRLLRD